MAVFVFLILAAADPVGTAVDVHDGDTLTLSIDGTRERIRLAGIDAPELGQAFGPEARKGLRDLVAGRELRVVRRGRDRYGRTLADVYAGETHLNREMVLQGLAWQFTRYDRSDGLLRAQFDAYEAERGLWGFVGNAKPVPPWQWRSARRR